MFETVIQGVLLGGLYGLFALGLSMMFGVMRLTNIAQGDLIVSGAYGAIALAPLCGNNPVLVALVLIPLAMLLGYGLQVGVLNRTLGRNPLPSLVVTFGLSIILQNLLLELFSADPRAFELEGLNTMSLSLPGDVAVGVLPLIILGMALFCTGSMQFMFDRTALGRAFRAVSDDKEVAALMGLNAHRIYGIATGLAFGLIALAGVFQSLRTTVSPADGPMLLLFAFESVIIGGMGSFWGTLVGALVLGITQQVGFLFDPGWGVWFGHLVFLLVLVVKPNGLFPKTRG
jgi:branched-chain amino acid transport system permease protein